MPRVLPPDGAATEKQGLVGIDFLVRQVHEPVSPLRGALGSAG